MVFHILPTAMELTMVCSILAYNFGPSFAMVTATTMATYSWFTIQTTAWRTKFRKQANAADNQAATTVVDSLINFESVKVKKGKAPLLELERKDIAFLTHKCGCSGMSHTIFFSHSISTTKTSN